LLGSGEIEERRNATPVGRPVHAAIASAAMQAVAREGSVGNRADAGAKSAGDLRTPGTRRPAQQRASIYASSIRLWFLIGTAADPCSS
jgi:hypothetical protein